jgi:Mce-associated membrane protein
VVVARTYDALTADPLSRSSMSDKTARAAVLVGTAALVICTTAAALAGVAAKQLSGGEKSSSLREQALAAGRQIAIDFAAYDYRHLKDDFNRVENESTGGFKSNYASQSAEVQDLIIKAKAVSTAEIASAGVVDAGPRSATVVIALNRTVTNTSAPSGQKDSFGVQIDLRHISGHWVASKVTPL